jgi:YidC/Oxa1 family membrane protein insertase
LADFQNPQHEPGTEQRLLLVLALTFLVVVLFQPLLKKYLPQPPTPAVQPQAQSPQAQAPPASAPSPTAPAQSPVSPAAVTKQASAETETVIENDFYRITFTNRGGQVKSWILKQFEDDRGKPLDLVNSAASAKYDYPLSLWTYDETLRNKLNSALYVLASDHPAKVEEVGATLTAPAEITFEYADRDVTARKTFRFDQTYVVSVETSVLAKGSQIPAFPAWPAGFGDEFTPAAYAASRIEYHNDQSSERSYLFLPKLTERLAIKAISSGNTLRGPFNWGGVVNQYFAAVFIPEDQQNAALVMLRNSIDIPKDWQKPNSQDLTKAEVLGTAVGNLRGPTVERLFVGPKSLKVVESVPVAGTNGQADLRDLINFGFFGVIARPLFLWLRWTYAHIVPNWGWAIVIQTLIITVALLPLRISSMKSALKMQKLQPQMNAIKEKYKKYSMRDPRKQDMNQEIAALMKKEGASPVGGCLPMVIQMPFLFAYYSMLGAALDLRHAHWLWISDLSSHDPYYILPIGIIVTMLFTQKMTPQAGMDPAQQKMMNLMMPVMMGVISFNLAAGLCLYWSESTLIGIVQQAVMNRTSLGREMREIALKRARKKEK